MHIFFSITMPYENELLRENRWNTVCTRRCKFYRLPTGKFGKECVEMLNCELEMILKSNISSEQLLVFSVLIIHRKNKARHSKDVKITIENRLKERSTKNIKLLFNLIRDAHISHTKMLELKRANLRRNSECSLRRFQKGTSKMQQGSLQK